MTIRNNNKKDYSLTLALVSDTPESHFGSLPNGIEAVNHTIKQSNDCSASEPVNGKYILCEVKPPHSKSQLTARFHRALSPPPSQVNEFTDEGHDGLPESDADS